MSKSLYDQSLARLCSIILTLPEAKEVEAWGHPTFRAGKKMFAGVGEKDGVVSLGLKVGHDRQEELLRDKRFYPTPYAAHMGWVSLHIDRRTNWEEIGGLVLEAYRQVANKRMLKALEGGHADRPPRDRQVTKGRWQASSQASPPA